MATNFEQIVRSITEFYDFAGKTVVVVGAGRGQLVGYVQSASRVIAIDLDRAATNRLAVVVRERGLTDKFEIVHDDFLELQTPGDVVVFEFCLHEMPNPKGALDHARTIARDVLVIDHAPGSPWSWHAAEDGGVEACWAAVAHASVGRRQDVEARQRFGHFAELEAVFAGQGPESRARIASFRGQQPIEISMPYRLALLVDGIASAKDARTA